MTNVIIFNFEFEKGKRSEKVGRKAIGSKVLS